MIVGIFGNLLTIIALIKCPKVRNVAAAFIIRWVREIINYSFNYWITTDDILAVSAWPTSSSAWLCCPSMPSGLFRARGRTVRSCANSYRSFSMQMWAYLCSASPWLPSIGEFCYFIPYHQWDTFERSWNPYTMELIDDVPGILTTPGYYLYLLRGNWISLLPSRYVMITHHSLYARIYKKHWIAMMLVFCWLFSYGMQLPTLLNVWGEH